MALLEASKYFASSKHIVCTWASKERSKTITLPVQEFEAGVNQAASAAVPLRLAIGSETQQDMPLFQVTLLLMTQFSVDSIKNRHPDGFRQVLIVKIMKVFHHLLENFIAEDNNACMAHRHDLQSALQSMQNLQTAMQERVLAASANATPASGQEAAGNDVVVNGGAGAGSRDENQAGSSKDTEVVSDSTHLLLSTGK